MAANYFQQYMTPRRRGYGGGMDWLGPVGRSLQARGTPGGTLLGMLLQAIGGQQAAASDAEDRAQRARHYDLVNQDLENRLDPEVVAANKRHALSSADSAGFTAKGQEIKLPFIQPNEQINLDANKLALSEAQRKTEIAKKQQAEEEAAKAQGSYKWMQGNARAKQLFEAGMDPISIVEVLRREGQRIPTSTDMQPLKDRVDPATLQRLDLQSAVLAGSENPVARAASGALSLALLPETLARQYNTEGMAGDLAPVRQATETKRVADLLKEETKAVAFVQDLTKNNLALMRGIAGLPEETPVGDPGSEAAPSLAPNDLGGLTLNVGGQSRHLTPERAKQWQQAYDEVLFARDVLGKARASGQPVTMKLFAPLFTKDALTRSVVKPPPETFLGGADLATPPGVFGLKPEKSQAARGSAPAAAKPTASAPAQPAAEPSAMDVLIERGKGVLGLGNPFTANRAVFPLDVNKEMATSMRQQSGFGGPSAAQRPPSVRPEVHGEFGVITNAGDLLLAGHPAATDPKQPKMVDPVIAKKVAEAYPGDTKARVKALKALGYVMKPDGTYLE